MNNILELLVYNLLNKSSLYVSSFMITTTESSFIFRNVKFFLIPEVLIKDKEEIGLIRVYTYYAEAINGSHLNLLKHFEVRVFADETIKMKNHENYSNSLKTPRVDENGYITCEASQFPSEFFKQLETMLIKQQIPLEVYRGKE